MKATILTLTLVVLLLGAPLVAADATSNPPSVEGEFRKADVQLALEQYKRLRMTAFDLEMEMVTNPSDEQREQFDARRLLLLKRAALLRVETIQREASSSMPAVGEDDVEHREAIDLDAIQDKVSVKLGQQRRIRFTADGDRLLEPMSVAQVGDGKATVEIRLDTTDATPGPEDGVSTRPFLTVSNGLGRTLTFRVLARHKGSQEFFETGIGCEPIGAGDRSTKCWESGSLIEEVVLFQFAAVPEPSLAEWVTTRFGRPVPRAAFWSMEPRIVQQFEPSGIGAEIHRVGDYTILHNTAIYWSHEGNQDDSHDMEASVIVFKGEKRVFVARGYQFDSFESNPESSTFSIEYWSGVMGDDQIEHFHFDAASDVLKVTTTKRNT